MHNILTIIFLLISITNFCSGQIESNISLGIDEFLLKNPESETSYETKDIKIYSEKAMRKKLKKY